ncbi:MAG: flavin reductase family protein [Infirmifilum sp.]|jgi:flavin reductase (DIM6/NTAB) family NADH-FMN oxidoreductase RutF|nr:flavin reductase family protein [Infirmifilum uzonense]
MSNIKYIEVDIRRHTRLLHPKLVVLIVTSSSTGKINIMPASWVMPTSVNPPLVTLALSPRRYTYELLQSKNEFTVNPVSMDMLKVVDYTGSVSGRETDKLRGTGIRLLEPKALSTPCIDDSLACIECKLWAQYPAGDHVLVVGRVMAARVLGKAWRNDSYVLDVAKPLFHLGGDNYTTVTGDVFAP